MYQLLLCIAISSSVYAMPDLISSNTYLPQNSLRNELRLNQLQQQNIENRLSVRDAYIQDMSTQYACRSNCGVDNQYLQSYIQEAAHTPFIAYKDSSGALYSALHNKIQLLEHLQAAEMSEQIALCDQLWMYGYVSLPTFNKLGNVCGIVDIPYLIPEEICSPDDIIMYLQQDIFENSMVLEQQIKDSCLLRIDKSLRESYYSNHQDLVSLDSLKQQESYIAWQILAGAFKDQLSAWTQSIRQCKEQKIVMQLLEERKTAEQKEQQRELKKLEKKQAFKAARQQEQKECQAMHAQDLAMRVMMQFEKDQKEEILKQQAKIAEKDTKIFVSKQKIKKPESSFQKKVGVSMEQQQLKETKKLAVLTPKKFVAQKAASAQVENDEITMLNDIIAANHIDAVSSISHCILKKSASSARQKVHSKNKVIESEIHAVMLRYYKALAGVCNNVIIQDEQYVELSITIDDIIRLQQKIHDKSLGCISNFISSEYYNLCVDLVKSLASMVCFEPDELVESKLARQNAIAEISGSIQELQTQIAILEKKDAKTKEDLQSIEDQQNQIVLHERHVEQLELACNVYDQLFAKHLLSKRVLSFHGVGSILNPDSYQNMFDQQSLSLPLQDIRVCIDKIETSFKAMQLSSWIAVESADYHRNEVLKNIEHILKKMGANERDVQFLPQEYMQSVFALAVCYKHGMLDLERVSHDIFKKMIDNYGLVSEYSPSMLKTMAFIQGQIVKAFIKYGS